MWSSFFAKVSVGQTSGPSLIKLSCFNNPPPVQFFSREDSSWGFGPVRWLSVLPKGAGRFFVGSEVDFESDLEGPWVLQRVYIISAV